MSMGLELTVSNKDIKAVNTGICSGDDLSLQVDILCRKILQKSAKRLSFNIGGCELTLKQVYALMKIAECNSISQNELGRLLVMDRSNIHKLVAQLKAQGLVSIEKHPEDARKLTIQLSDKGASLIDEVEPVQREYVNKHISVLNEDEQQQLLQLMERLADACYEE